MIDTSFLEEQTVDSVNEIDDYQYKATELKALTQLANKVGLYEWQYDVPAEGIVLDGKTHLGPILQDLQRVEGLASAVSTNPEGYLEADSRYIALAALSYIAALTRVLTRIPYDKPEIQE